VRVVAYTLMLHWTAWPRQVRSVRCRAALCPPLTRSSFGAVHAVSGMETALAALLYACAAALFAAAGRSHASPWLLAPCCLLPAGDGPGCPTRQAARSR
jgi:hypothetical protein